MIDFEALSSESTGSTHISATNNGFLEIRRAPPPEPEPGETDTPSSPPPRSDLISIQLTNHSSQELHVHIQEVSVRYISHSDTETERETERQADYEIMNHFQITLTSARSLMKLNRHYRIDLDPKETREYGILLYDEQRIGGNTKYLPSYHYQITAVASAAKKKVIAEEHEQTTTLTIPVKLSGYQKGYDSSTSSHSHVPTAVVHTTLPAVAPATTHVTAVTTTDATRYQEADKFPLTFFKIGMKIKVKRSILETDFSAGRDQAPPMYVDWEYVVEAEDGTPNDFCIFNRHIGNPTAAYLAMGREGYRSLAGLHTATLPWDHDTTSPEPPIETLRAVHIRNPITQEHGWFFREHLFVWL
jgi:hypothetical protein